MCRGCAWLKAGKLPEADRDLEQAHTKLIPPEGAKGRPELQLPVLACLTLQAEVADASAGRDLARGEPKKAARHLDRAVCFAKALIERRGPEDQGRLALSQLDPPQVLTPHLTLTAAIAHLNA